jgi:hypothetical protein
MLVIQKVSSDGLLKKKNKNLFPNHLYCHFMYIPCTTFQHSSHHFWGNCHSGAPVFVSLHRRMSRLRCKPCVNGYFDLIVVVEPPATKESFQMQEHMKSTWLLVWAVRGIIELFPAKCHDEILRCGGSVWADIVMKHHSTPTEHATLLVSYTIHINGRCMWYCRTWIWLCWGM